jgi:hypothetical protein
MIWAEKEELARSRLVGATDSTSLAFDETEADDVMVEDEDEDEVDREDEEEEEEEEGRKVMGAVIVLVVVIGAVW